jgi:hypothetical protein
MAARFQDATRGGNQTPMGKWRLTLIKQYQYNCPKIQERILGKQTRVSSPEDKDTDCLKKQYGFE